MKKNKDYFKSWRAQNKNKIKRNNKKCYEKHKELRAEYARKQYAKNQKQRKQYTRNYYQEHKKEINQKLNKKFIKRRKVDVKFKILCNLRKRIWKVLKENSRSKSTLKLLGCSLENLKKHLESKFTKGMAFSNYGKWHIDHIIPCARFDLTKESEQAKCFHYSNLQPLWALDNIIKSDKIIQEDLK